MPPAAARSEPAAGGDAVGQEMRSDVLLWTCPEMYVYQIPPLKSESGAPPAPPAPPASHPSRRRTG